MPETKDNTRNAGSPSAYTVRFVSPNPRSQVFDELDNGLSTTAVSIREETNNPGQRFYNFIAGVKNAAFPVILALVIALVSVFGFVHTFKLITFPFGTAPGTLSTINGIVEIKSPDNALKTGSIGMELSAGMVIKTAAGSTATLAFLDGSTLKMGPETELEIQQLDFNDKQAVAIVMKQWVGSTWSSVEKMSGTASRYEIVTPSATVLVHGTKFSVEVDKTGKTTQHTSQGLVSVKAQGQEVFVSPGQSTYVESGSGPAAPQQAPPPDEPEKQIARQYGVAQNRRYTPPAFGPGGYSGNDINMVNTADDSSQGNGDNKSGSSTDFSGGQNNPDKGQEIDQGNSATNDKPEESNDNKGGSSGGSNEDKEKKNANNSDKGNNSENNTSINPGNNKDRNDGGNGNANNSQRQGGGNNGQDNPGNSQNNNNSSGGDDKSQGGGNGQDNPGNNQNNNNSSGDDKSQGGDGNGQDNGGDNGNDKDKDKEKNK